MPAATTLGDAIEEAMRCSAGPSQYLSVAEIERRILAMGNCPTLKRPENLPTSISNYLRNNQSRFYKMPGNQRPPLFRLKMHSGNSDHSLPHQHYHHHHQQQQQQQQSRQQQQQQHHHRRSHAAAINSSNEHPHRQQQEEANLPGTGNRELEDEAYSPAPSTPAMTNTKRSHSGAATTPSALGAAASPARAVTPITAAPASAAAAAPTVAAAGNGNSALRSQPAVYNFIESMRDIETKCQEGVDRVNKYIELINYLKKAPVDDDEVMQVIQNKQAQVNGVTKKRRKIRELRSLGAKMRRDVIEFFEITRELQEDSIGQNSS